jgi:hypothetical protein
MYNKAQDQIIQECRTIWGSRYDYSKVEYNGCREKVNIICPEHGVFKMKLGHHKAGKGCYKCGRVSSGLKNKKSLSCTQDKFVQKANAKHGPKYDYTEAVYTHSYSTVIIGCPNHGPFELRACSHLEGQGCPKCSTEQRIKRLTKFKSKEDIEQLIVSKFGSKIKLICVPEVLRRTTEVTVECHAHGQFTTKLSYLNTNKFGCKDCGYTSAAIQRSKTTEEFISECLKVHGDEYDYSQTIWTHADKKASFICKKHGVFQQYVGAHLSGSGCSKCRRRISKPCSEWIASYNNPNILQEYRIGRKFVDGFDPSTNTIYEFYGDYWHGNPQKYPADLYNPSCKTTMGQLYAQTLKRSQYFQDLDYNLVEIWESEWMSR